MNYLKVFVIGFVFVSCSAQTVPIKPCKNGDLKCLGEAAKEFIEKTANGLPEYDCKPTDPMTLDSMTFEQPEVKITLSNIVVTGMKGLQLTEFRMDENEKRTDFNMTLNLGITQDIQMEFTDPKKTFTGRQTGEMNVACMIGYNWDVVKDAAGDHYALGPETVTCENITPPELTLNPEMATELQNDSQINKNWEANKEELMKKRRRNSAKLAEKAFSGVMENFRKCAMKLKTTDLISN